MKNIDRPFLIAITGNIASGKTIVCQWFKEKGFNVISADKIGHKILEKPEIGSILEDRFGSIILSKNKIDRKKLGEIVFEDHDKLEFLNRLLHPLIRSEMQNIIDTSKSEFLFFEIPLLFENKLENAFDLTINISSPGEIRIERLLQRDNITEKTALRIISNQMPDMEKMKKADVNMINDHGLRELYLQLEKIFGDLHRYNYRDVRRLVAI
ncbi:MAG: dephospho-CoA kinase [Candidatus Cloacimonetes bacterium]|nr:dephospho-CoA kinase [Candidatus Cloacimonadota bacterium]